MGRVAGFKSQPTPKLCLSGEEGRQADAGGRARGRSTLRSRQGRARPPARWFLRAGRQHKLDVCPSACPHLHRQSPARLLYPPSCHHPGPCSPRHPACAVLGQGWSLRWGRLPASGDSGGCLPICALRQLKPTREILWFPLGNVCCALFPNLPFCKGPQFTFMKNANCRVIWCDEHLQMIPSVSSK